MPEASQYVDEAMEALHALGLGQSNGLSPYLFQEVLNELGNGNPQICLPLKRALVNEDDMNVRLRVLELIGETGPGWADIFGPQIADAVVLSIADSNPKCAAYACRAIQYWEDGGEVSTPLLHWAKRHLPGLWEAGAVEPAQMPSIPKMIQELPSYVANIEERRSLNNTHPSLENSIRLWGKVKGMMLSMFNRG